MNIENRKFKNKGEVFWFNVFEAVTSNYLTKEEKDKQQQHELSKKHQSAQRYNRFNNPNARDIDEYKKM
eukprot:CAMPEP_0116871540 /NCGR_PEP_ID=MMETSP0463-20121206/1936_1 /TAXON_ID=181622 /ORGANISM="Strombidinopsis sp, Strain SopsisLIS2011" /LENGTH=68 /DNA_ID=CAMNT_0004510155 /DNA_START=736 /DNA_END=942 /DNA_ORIENTATION=+